jgi:shikimate kinase
VTDAYDGVGAPSRPLVVLVGPPGAGKTTVGRLLAERTGRGFRDTDADVEATAGKAISDIFFDEGEDAFRALERQAVAEALATHDGVLALGGGAVLAAETRALLAQHRVAFLSVGLSDAATRVGMSTVRPVLALNPRAQLKTLLEQRLPLYREVATVTVETDGRSTHEVADELLQTLTTESPGTSS